MKAHITSIIAVSFAASAAQASLWVDFNSGNQDGGEELEPGYQAFTRDHENTDNPDTNGIPNVGASGDLDEDYATTFAGSPVVTLTAAWPNTTNFNVRQSINRTASNGIDPATGFDASWADDTGLALVTDFLGIDTRTGNGGLGNWDGTTGTPTYMTLTLSGLGAGIYNWTSFHHDTENVHGDFAVWIDTGSGFVQLADGVMTDGTAAGNPDSGATVSDFAGMESAGSIYETSFTANGTDDVTIRFAPYANTAVHRQIFGVNGFQLEQIPEPSTGLLSLLGVAMAFRRRR
ncbi:MAG: PEP-CTERM sorting domain-containing protein [Akkermansiaceae bacterium]